MEYLNDYSIPKKYKFKLVVNIFDIQEQSYNQGKNTWKTRCADRKKWYN